MRPVHHALPVATSIVLCSLALGMWSCSPEASERKAPPIEDSVFVDVLVDLHLADARREVEPTPPGLRDTVLATHGLDEAQLQEVVDYYARNPEAYARVYEQVLDRLHATYNRPSTDTTGRVQRSIPPPDGPSPTP